MEITIAVLAAVAAAVSFGAGVALQHRQVQTVGSSDGTLLRLYAQLLRRRLWLIGIGLTVTAYGLQGLALSFGPLALVAPVVALDLVIAIPLAARWSRRQMCALDWVGCALATGGVALFVATSPTGSARATAAGWRWGVVTGIVALVVACALGAALHARGGARAALLSVAAGVTFGLTAAVTLSLARELRSGGRALPFGTWEPAALVALGVAGLALSASAYRAGELSTSLPIMDSTEPLSAVLLGVLIFGERLSSSHTGLLLQLAGAAFAVVGIVILGRSPLIHPVSSPVRDVVGTQQ